MEADGTAVIRYIAQQLKPLRDRLDALEAEVSAIRAEEMQRAQLAEKPKTLLMATLQRIRNL